MNYEEYKKQRKCLIDDILDSFRHTTNSTLDNSQLDIFLSNLDLNIIEQIWSRYCGNNDKYDKGGIPQEYQSLENNE